MRLVRRLQERGAACKTSAGARGGLSDVCRGEERLVRRLQGPGAACQEGRLRGASARTLADPAMGALRANAESACLEFLRLRAHSATHAPMAPIHRVDI